MDENIVALIGGIALAVLLALVLMKRQKAKAAEAWDAVVTKVSSRDFVRQEDAPAETYVKVEYQRSDGKRDSFQLPEAQFQHHYPSLKAGDRLTKPAGELTPRVVN